MSGQAVSVSLQGAEATRLRAQSHAWKENAETDEQFLMISTTRFGEISPLRQQKLSFWQFLWGSFSHWQYFEPTLAILYAIGQSFVC